MLSADPLSQVLSLLSARSLLSASLRARGDWSVAFEATGVKFNAVLEGGCYLLSEEWQEPVRLEEGDCFLLINCPGYVLCSDPHLTPVAAHSVFSGHNASLNPDAAGTPLFSIGGRISLNEVDAGLLLDELPPILLVSGRSRQASAIRWLLEKLAEEWREGLPGGAVAADHLAQLLFVEVIRLWLRSETGPTSGWLHAIGDRRVGTAIRLLHGEPARNWRLEDLAEASGMSRSNFALRFKQLAGLAPLDYLLRWRMRLGAKALREGTEPVSAISFSLGYRSESAFSNAFKRVTGSSPQQYRREHRGSVLADVYSMSPESSHRFRDKDMR